MITNVYCWGCLSGVSEALSFQLFYGWEIRYGPEGVDLSAYNSITKQVPRARERTWGSITTWLYSVVSA